MMISGYNVLIAMMHRIPTILTLTLVALLSLKPATAEPRPKHRAPAPRTEVRTRGLAKPSLQEPPRSPLDARKPDGSAELHAHLFMKEGMSWGFCGGFHGPLEATSWRNRFSSMSNPDALNRSGLGLVVATLYAHPLFTFDMRESIRRQIALAEKFVIENPEWVLARDPFQATRDWLRGKRLMVLALEGADGIIETEEDIREFVQRKGIRILTYLHLTDDQFGGVAFLWGPGALSSPMAFFRSLLSPVRDPYGARLNARGLTDRGRRFLIELLHRKVWIDLAHASDASQREMIPLIRAAGQPLLYTHTTLRRYHGAERGITDWQLDEVRGSGGIIGLIPSEDMLRGTKPAPEFCPSGCAPGSCEGSVHSLAVHYQEVATRISNESTVMGSDYNGGLRHLRPSCSTGTALDREGLWNMGLIPELWSALRAVHAPVPQDLNITITRFLEAWGKVFDPPGS